MDLQPIDLPPGFSRNGTEYKNRNRWVDGSLVRFREDTVEPVGGWDRRTLLSTGADIASLVADPDLEAYRDAIAWDDNSGDNNAVFGSNLAVKHMSSGGIITDITPAGSVTSGKDSQTEAGYGQNPYGFGAYGASNNLSGTKPIPPQRWAFTNWGQDLLLAQRGAGAIYYYTPGGASLAVGGSAPSDIQDMVVTDERILFTIGGGGNARDVAWSDQEDRTEFAPTAQNQAGSQTLSGNGKLLRCVSVLGQILILGEEDASVARYVLPPYVFSITKVADKCGPISTEAVATTDRFAVWMGDKTFWLFDGTVRPLECAVRDFVFKDMDDEQTGKIAVVTQTAFNEVWWLYQSNDGDDIDKYVVWNYLLDVWYTGSLARTVGLDEGVLLTPVMISTVGEIYNHELDDVLPDEDVYVVSGPLEVQNGAKNFAIRQVIFDTTEQGDASITFFTKQFPTGAEQTIGTYLYNNPCPTKVMGRQVKMRLNLLTSTARVGTMRVDPAPIQTLGRR